MVANGRMAVVEAEDCDDTRSWGGARASIRSDKVGESW